MNLVQENISSSNFYNGIIMENIISIALFMEDISKIKIS